MRNMFNGAEIEKLNNETALIVKETEPFLYKGLESSEMQTALRGEIVFSWIFSCPDAVREAGRSSIQKPIGVDYLSA